MPFIRGRYHINPVAGEALEAAREAEAALLALEQAAHASDERDGDAVSPGSAPAKGPVHHIEIEAAEMVPAHSGRASRGFVTRVHRTILPQPGGHVDDQADGFADEPASSYRPAGVDYLSRVNNYGGGGAPWSGGASNGSAPETHVFADHQDLLGFLHDLLANDCCR